MVLYYGDHPSYAHAATMFGNRHVHNGLPASAHPYNALNALAATYGANQNQAGGQFDFPQYSSNAPVLTSEQLHHQHQSAMASAYFYDYRGAPDYRGASNGHSGLTSPVSIVDDPWGAFSTPTPGNISSSSSNGSNQLGSPGFRTSPASSSSVGADNYLSSNSCAHNMFSAGNSHHQAVQNAMTNLNHSAVATSSSNTCNASQMLVSSSPGHHHQNGIRSATKAANSESSSSHSCSGAKVSKFDWMNKTNLHNHQPTPSRRETMTGVFKRAFRPPTLVQKSSLFVYISAFDDRRKTRTKDKYRVVYSDHQRIELEKEFFKNKYISVRRKAEMAHVLMLSERQVKIWFQNRRAKERKQNKKKFDPTIGHGASKLGCNVPAMSSSVHNNLQLIQNSMMQASHAMSDDRHYDSHSHINHIKLES